MKKLNILIHTKESLEKSKLELDEQDDDFELGVAYVDLKEIQSMNESKDTWRGRSTFFIYLSATSYTIVGDIEQLAEEVEKVKMYNILGIN